MWNGDVRISMARDTTAAAMIMKTNPTFQVAISTNEERREKGRHVRRSFPEFDSPRSPRPSSSSSSSSSPASYLGRIRGVDDVPDPDHRSQKARVNERAVEPSRQDRIRTSGKRRSMGVRVIDPWAYGIEDTNGGGRRRRGKSRTCSGPVVDGLDGHSNGFSDFPSPSPSKERQSVRVQPPLTESRRRGSPSTTEATSVLVSSDVDLTSQPHKRPRNDPPGIQPPHHTTSSPHIRPLQNRPAPLPPPEHQKEQNPTPNQRIPHPPHPRPTTSTSIARDIQHGAAAAAVASSSSSSGRKIWTPWMKTKPKRKKKTNPIPAPEPKRTVTAQGHEAPPRGGHVPFVTQAALRVPPNVSSPVSGRKSDDINGKTEVNQRKRKFSTLGLDPDLDLETLQEFIQAMDDQDPIHHTTSTYPSLPPPSSTGAEEPAREGTEVRMNQHPNIVSDRTNPVFADPVPDDERRRDFQIPKRRRLETSSSAFVPEGVDVRLGSAGLPTVLPGSEDKDKDKDKDKDGGGGGGGGGDTEAGRDSPAGGKGRGHITVRGGEIDGVDATLDERGPDARDGQDPMSQPTANLAGTANERTSPDAPSGPSGFLYEFQRAHQEALCAPPSSPKSRKRTSSALDPRRDRRIQPRAARKTCPESAPAPSASDVHGRLRQAPRSAARKTCPIPQYNESTSTSSSDAEDEISSDADSDRPRGSPIPRRRTEKIVENSREDSSPAKPSNSLPSSLGSGRLIGTGSKTLLTPPPEPDSGAENDRDRESGSRSSVRRSGPSQQDQSTQTVDAPPSRAATMSRSVECIDVGVGAEFRGKLWSGFGYGEGAGVGSIGDRNVSPELEVPSAALRPHERSTSQKSADGRSTARPERRGSTPETSKYFTKGSSPRSSRPREPAPPAWQNVTLEEKRYETFATALPSPSPSPFGSGMPTPPAGSRKEDESVGLGATCDTESDDFPSPRASEGRIKLPRMPQGAAKMRAPPNRSPSPTEILLRKSLFFDGYTPLHDSAPSRLGPPQDTSTSLQRHSPPLPNAVAKTNSVSKNPNAVASAQDLSFSILPSKPPPTDLPPSASSPSSNPRPGSAVGGGSDAVEVHFPGQHRDRHVPSEQEKSTSSISLSSAQTDRGPLSSESSSLGGGGGGGEFLGCSESTNPASETALLQNIPPLNDRIQVVRECETSDQYVASTSMNECAQQNRPRPGSSGSYTGQSLRATSEGTSSLAQLGVSPPTPAVMLPLDRRERMQGILSHYRKGPLPDTSKPTAPRPRNPKMRIPIIGTALVSSKAMQPLQEGDKTWDSEDDLDDGHDWEDQGHALILRTYAELSKKQILVQTLWSSFARQYRLISFRHLADCAERFIRAYATNLDKAGARDDLLLHFTNLGLAGMIKVEEQAKCMRLYDRLVAEAKMAMED